MIQKAFQGTENKLNYYKLKTTPESALPIDVLIKRAQKMELKIDEELENVLALEDHINEINDKIREINREQSRCNTTLVQCESALNLRQDDVIQALNSCEVDFRTHFLIR